VFAPHVLVDTPAPDGKSKVRVGVIGAVRFNPVFLKAGPDGTNMVIGDPVQRVRAEVQALQAERADVIVLLAAAHIDDARRIARDVPGLDAILGSYGGQVTEVEERVGDTLILYCGNKGQRLSEVRVQLSTEGAPRRVAGLSPMLHLLTREYPNDQATLDFLATLQAPPMPGEQGAEHAVAPAGPAPPGAPDGTAAGPPREGG
jgi:2',3'-cyclic-nucleotide 2'-phosphodiesterase (5'-nucleotidase family)